MLMLIHLNITRKEIDRMRPVYFRKILKVFILKCVFLFLSQGDNIKGIIDEWVAGIHVAEI